MKLVTVMVVVLIIWCVYTIVLRHSPLPPFPHPRNIHLTPDALGWLAHSNLPQMFGVVAIFIALGHSVLAMSGEESLAQVYREIESPKLPNLKKAGMVIFVYSLLFTSLVSFFAVMIIPDDVRQGFLENLIGGSGDESGRADLCAADLPRICGRGGHADSGGRGEHRDRRVQRRIEPRVRRRRAERVVPAAASEIRHELSHHQHRGGAADRDDPDQPRRRDVPREPVCLRRDLEFRHERPGGAGAALHRAGRTRIPGAVQSEDSRRAVAHRAGHHHPDAVPDCGHQPLHQADCHHGWRCFLGDFVRGVHDFREKERSSAPAAFRMWIWTSSTWNWRAN